MFMYTKKQVVSLQFTSAVRQGMKRFLLSNFWREVKRNPLDAQVDVGPLALSCLGENTGQQHRKALVHNGKVNARIGPSLLCDDLETAQYGE